MKNFAGSGLLMLLAACVSQGPPGADASIAPPDRWRTDTGPVAPVDRYWWRQFGDPVLNDVVETALAHNDDLAMATARVAEARASERVGRAGLMPQVAVGAIGGGVRDIGASDTGETEWLARPLFIASWEADLFGRLHNEADAAQLSAEAAVAARDAMALSIAAAAARGYILLRALDQQLWILRQAQGGRAEALRIARDQAQAGLVSDLVWRQAEGEYAEIAQRAVAAELAVSTQEHALSLLMGTPPQTIGRGLEVAALARPAVPAGLPSDLLRKRPDISAAEYRLAASDANLAAARAAFMPRIHLTGSGGLALSDRLADPIGVWSLGASILAPIFEGGRLSAGRDAAAARRDQAAFAYRRAVLMAFQEVEDSLAAVARFGEQRTHAQARKTAWTAALRHAQNRVEAGYSPYLELLDAQRRQIDSALELVRAEAGQLLALVALHEAMGGGWGSDGGATG